MPHNPQPQLADVICKVKLRQPLLPQEEFVYLVHIEGLPEEEAERLVTKWYETNFDKKNYSS